MYRQKTARLSKSEGSSYGKNYFEVGNTGFLDYVSFRDILDLFQEQKFVLLPKDSNLSRQELTNKLLENYREVNQSKIVESKLPISQNLANWI